MKRKTLEKSIKFYVNNWWNTSSKSLVINKIAIINRKIKYLKSIFVFFLTLIFINFLSLFILYYFISEKMISQYFLYLPFITILPLIFLIILIIENFSKLRDRISQKLEFLKLHYQKLNDKKTILNLFQEATNGYKFRILDIDSLTKTDFPSSIFNYEKLNTEFIFNDFLKIKTEFNEIKIGSVFKIKSLNKKRSVFSFLNKKISNDDEMIIINPPYNKVSDVLLIESTLPIFFKGTILKNSKINKKLFLKYFSKDDLTVFNQRYKMIKGKKDKIYFSKNKIYLQINKVQKVFENINNYEDNKKFISLLPRKSTNLFFNNFYDNMYHFIKPSILYSLNPLEFISKKKIRIMYFKNMEKDINLINNVVDLIEIFNKPIDK